MSREATRQSRRSAEARAWRLALLLTRDTQQAAEVAIQVRRAQPKLERLDPRRLDRLVVLRSREVAQRRRRPAPAQEAEPPPEQVRPLLDALRRLGHQVQEAWIFARVDELGEIEMARAMDCSKSAAARFLAEADSALAGSPGELPARIDALRNWLGSLAPQEAIEARRAVHRRRRRMKAAAWLVGAAVCAGAAAVAVLAIL